MTRSEKSVHIQFAADSSGGDFLAVRLDETQNRGESQFPYGTNAYFQVFTRPAGAALDIKVSDGRLSPAGEGSESIEETVYFDRTSEASVSLPIRQIQTATWLGRSLGGVTSRGATGIRAGRSGVGVLKLTYLADFRRYSVRLDGKNEDEWPVLASARSGDGENRPQKSITLHFIGDGAGTGRILDYRLYVINKCTQAPLDDVAVYLDGVYRGRTDSNGSILFANLISGTEHDIRVDHPGFDPASPSFTVPEPGDE